MTLRASSVRFIPLWAAIVPLLTINVCYLVAVEMGHVRACIPYLEGCTAVSSTGRKVPESLIFKAGFLPSALVLAIFWHYCARFLELTGQAGARQQTLRVLGMTAGISLALYALTLGLNDGYYPELRRAGIVGFTLSTFLAEVLFWMFYAPLRTDTTRRIWVWLIVLSLALPMLDITSEIAKWAGAPRKPTNNTIAWNAFVITSAYYAVVARLWWHHGFASQLSVRSGGRAASPRG